MLSQQQAALQELYQERFAAYRSVSTAEQGLSEVHSNVYRLLTWIANLDAEKVKQMTAEQTKRVAAVSEEMGNLAKRPGISAEAEGLHASVSKRLGSYKADIAKAIELSTVDATMGIMLMQNADSAFQALLKDFERLVEMEKASAEASYVATNAAFDRIVVTLLVIVVLSLVISAGAALFMSRIIVRPLQRAKEVAARIAAGDLTADIRVNSNDETGELLKALNEMNHALAGIGTGGQKRNRCNRHRVGRDRSGQRRPVEPHRGAGLLAGRDRLLDGRTDLHRQAERRQRAPGQPARRRRLHDGGQGRRSGRPGGRTPWRRSTSPRGRSPTSSA